MLIYAMAYLAVGGLAVGYAGYAGWLPPVEPPGRQRVTREYGSVTTYETTRLWAGERVAMTVVFLLAWPIGVPIVLAYQLGDAGEKVRSIKEGEEE